MASASVPQTRQGCKTSKQFTDRVLLGSKLVISIWSLAESVLSQELIRDWWTLAWLLMLCDRKVLLLPPMRRKEKGKEMSRLSYETPCPRQLIMEHVSWGAQVPRGESPWVSYHGREHGNSPVLEQQCRVYILIQTGNWHTWEWSWLLKPEPYPFQ